VINMRDYATFLDSKRFTAPTCGVSVDASEINPMLFPFQRDLVRWALRKGRAAVFADTGLGKTPIQLEWATRIGQRALILAPLSVARQTVREGTKFGYSVHYTRSGDDLSNGINITNYEMLEHFGPTAFGSVVLDESSILKSIDGYTRIRLNEMFARTPYRLCCTATPAPNDISEIANHAEFLGIMNRSDMLATFFVHDDSGWRLKKHAETPFYRWLASWGMSIRKPSDLDYPDDGYNLPPLTVKPVFVPTDYKPDDTLFFMGLSGVTDRSKVRRETLAERVAEAAALVNGDSEQWIVWCGLNDEGRALAAAIPDAVLVEGDQSVDEKIAAIEGFQDGKYRVMITKPRIAGLGMNLQNCHKMAFVGLSDSFESWYQCIRRCYRYGQQRPVEVFIVLSEIEDAIYENVMRKEREAERMSTKLIENVQEFERSEIADAHSDWEYSTAVAQGENWKLLLGDSVERLGEVPDESVGLSVFSPPFLSLYTYSPTERDIGNSRSEEEFFAHFGFIIDHLLRVTKPGRNCCVHVAQVPAMLSRDGYIGLKDFRGKTIREFIDHGWVYHGEVCVDKDPQAQAIRTKSKALLFVQMRKDSSWSRPALADYVLVFRKPGDNLTAIKPDISNDEWIEWARPIWYGIKESDTLQYHEARGEDDERHICPLQIGTIERVVRLWSNPGETVLSPFAGIGSEGYVALKYGRRFIGIELKPEYWKVAARNLERAERERRTPDLFSYAKLHAN
jgi:DNA modification methylase